MIRRLGFEGICFCLRSIRAYALVALVTALFLSTGCSHPKQQDTEAPLTRAYRLIDEHRDDDAIEFLNELVAQQPRNQDYQVALASAYAHKAGIKIEDFTEIVNNSKRPVILPHSLALVTARDLNSQMSYKVDDFNDRLASLLSDYAHFLRIYAQIPNVRDQDDVYLQQAIRIMTSFKHLRPSDAMYLVVLRVIEIKHDLATHLVGRMARGRLDAQGNCVIDLNKVENTVVSLGHMLIDVLNDLMIVNPSRIKQLAAQREQVADDTFSLTLVLTSMTLTDEASSLLLKQLIFEEGFGKLLSCGGGGVSKH